MFDLRQRRNGRPWLVTEKTYRVRKGWRVLLNGRDISFEHGLETVISEGDKIDIFPPGR